MILTEHSNKTFDEYLADNPGLYDNVDGYTWNEASNQWENTGVNEITKELIEDWFGLRNVCNNDHFARFFRRKMNVTALRYAQLARIELSAFDPLVADYIEHEIISKNSKTMAGSSSETTSGTTSNTTNQTSTRTPDLLVTEANTRTPNLSEATTGQTSGESSKTHGGSDKTEYDGTRSTTQGGSDVTTNAGSSNDNHVEMSKQAPQSIAYQGATAGNIPNLDWTYATVQGQAKNDHSENGTSTVQHGLTENGSDGHEETKTYGETENGTESGSNSQTVLSTGTETNSGTTATTGEDETVVVGRNEGQTSGTKSGQNSGTESGEGSTREISTGRGGLTPQEAFGKAAQYLKTSSAWEWLAKQLDECFMSVYDI